MSNHKGARAVCVYILGAPAYVCVGALFCPIPELFERTYAKTQEVRQVSFAHTVVPICFYKAFRLIFEKNLV